MRRLHFQRNQCNAQTYMSIFCDGRGEWFCSSDSYVLSYANPRSGPVFLCRGDLADSSYSVNSVETKMEIKTTFPTRVSEIFINTVIDIELWIPRSIGPRLSRTRTDATSSSLRLSAMASRSPMKILEILTRSWRRRISNNRRRIGQICKNK